MTRRSPSPLDYRTLSVPPEADDRRFLDDWIAGYVLCAPTAAAEVGVFEVLAEGGLGVRELARRLSLHEPTLESLCRVLVAHRVLTLRGDVFALTKSARLYRVRKSPHYRGLETVTLRSQPEHRRMVVALRERWAPLRDGERTVTEAWRSGDISPDEALGFSAVMHSIGLGPLLAAVRSGAFRRETHVVDVGGGSGVFAALLAAHQPATRVTLLDLPHVCDASRRLLANVASAKAVVRHPCNFFVDPWPTGASALLLANVLHDWPVRDAKLILRRARRALPAGGRVYLHESLLAPNRCAPTWTVAFDLLMHLNHGAQQFTREALAELLVQAGFTRPRVRSTYSYYTLLEARAR